VVREFERGGVAAESGERENFVAETGFGTHCSRGTHLREEESLWRRLAILFLLLPTEKANSQPSASFHIP